MALNSQPVSARMRSIQRMLRDVELGRAMSPTQLSHAIRMAKDCADDAERLEIAAGTATVSAQLKAARGNPVMMREVLRQDALRKVVRHG
ncbi:MAG: hypothetical protein KIS86_04605 [Devosia sp.]|nr:hypothetical protein [Devosia sp.]